MNSDGRHPLAAIFLLYGIIPAAAFILLKVLFALIRSSTIDIDFIGQTVVLVGMILMFGFILAVRRTKRAPD